MTEVEGKRIVGYSKDFPSPCCEARSPVVDSRACKGTKTSYGLTAVGVPSSDYDKPYTRRRRECSKCGARFTTVEILVVGSIDLRGDIDEWLVGECSD